MCTVLTSLDYYIYQDINVPGCEQFSQAWTIIYTNYINVPGCEQFSQAWTIIYTKILMSLAVNSSHKLGLLYIPRY